MTTADYCIKAAILASDSSMVRAFFSARKEVVAAAGIPLSMAKVMTSDGEPTCVRSEKRRKLERSFARSASPREK